MHFKNKTHNLQESNEFQRFTFEKDHSNISLLSSLAFWLKFHPLSAGNQPFSCLSWPGSFGNETSVKWATIAQQWDQSKDQILSLISINSPGFCAFCLPLSTFTTSLVPVRWASRHCLEEHRESAGRPCSVLQDQQHEHKTKCRKSEDKSVLC